MRHTYIFEEGVWTACGIYINDAGVGVDVRGRSVVVHQDELWVIELNMTLLPVEDREYRNLDFKTVYEVKPIVCETDATDWITYNQSMGRLSGKITVVHDSILSMYHTTNGMIRGMESLLKISNDRYHCRGALFERGRRTSSWFLQFERDYSG